MNKPSKRNEVEPAVLNVRDASAYLNISESTMRRLIRDRKVPFVRVGGSIRFRPIDLEKYLDQNSRIPKSLGESKKTSDEDNNVILGEKEIIAHIMGMKRMLVNLLENDGGGHTKIRKSIQSLIEDLGSYFK